MQLEIYKNGSFRVMNMALSDRNSYEVLELITIPEFAGKPEIPRINHRFVLVETDIHGYDIYEEI